MTNTQIIKKIKQIITQKTSQSFTSVKSNLKREAISYANLQNKSGVKFSDLRRQPDGWLRIPEHGLTVFYTNNPNHANIGKGWFAHLQQVGMKQLITIEKDA